MGRVSLKALYIEITSKCNLRCKHCYNESGNSNNEIDINALFRLFEQVASMGVDGISISGGEPFMSANFLPIIRELKKYPQFTVNIITNGTLFDEKTINDILQILPNPIFQISLDGIGEQHDLIRGKGTFKKVNDAISLLKSCGCGFYFHALIHRYNYKNIDEFIDYSRNIGVHKIDFAFLKRKGRGKCNYESLALTCSEQIELMKYMNAKKEIISTNGFQVSFPTIFYGICPIFSEKFSTDIFARVDVNGNVFACQNFDGNCNSLGNILEEDISKIITEERFKKQKEHFTKVPDNFNCESCFLSSFCGKGCPGVEYSDFEDLQLSSDCDIRREYARALLLGLKSKDSI